MEESQHRSHHASKHLWSCGQTEAEDLELPGLPYGCEPEILARRRVDRDLKVHILQMYGDHPVVPANRAKNRLRSLHLKRSPIHNQVQGGKVDDWPPTPPLSLGDNEHAAVEAWSWRRRLHRSLAAKSLNLLLQSPPFDRLGRVRIQDDGSRRQRRLYAKGNRIPLPQDFHHPRLRTHPSKRTTGGTGSRLSPLGKVPDFTCDLFPAWK